MSERFRDFDGLSREACQRRYDELKQLAKTSGLSLRQSGEFDYVNRRLHGKPYKVAGKTS